MDPINQTDDLAAAVFHLASTTCDFSDSDLGQPYQWGAHQEGVRFALLGAMHELRALAVYLLSQRHLAGLPITRAQHGLAQYHHAFRDIDAVLTTVTSDEYEKTPAVGEWPLRYVYGHMVGAERNFFALVHYGLRRQREGGELSTTLPDGEANRLLGSYNDFITLMETGSRADLAAYHANMHDRAMGEFSTIDDTEIEGLSVWWEGVPYTLEYRLHRMDAHLRQHTIQIEKTLDQLGRSPSEARRLIRMVFGALAEVEGVLIGASSVGQNRRESTAASIRSAADDARMAVDRANAFISAVTGGDREGVASHLLEDSKLVNSISRDGVPIVRLATYYGQQAIADKLLETPGIDLEIWDGAALGRLATVKEIHEGWGDFILNEFSRDGYTPLQLACFFGHEEVAAYLIEKGALVNAVSRNPMAIQPLHAASAGNHVAIVRLLLNAGADANAVQQDGFRPLHSAAQNGNSEIIRLLLEFGADARLPDDKGRFAREVAEEAGHTEIAGLLLG